MADTAASPAAARSPAPVAARVPRSTGSAAASGSDANAPTRFRD